MEEPWAKDNKQTLSQHVAECLEVARVIVPTLPLPEEEKRSLLNEVMVALAFHDCGKSATGFQKVLRGEKENWEGRRHEILSASLASSVQSVEEASIFAILTHHKSIPNSPLSEERRALDFYSIPLDEESDQSLTWRRMKKEWMENYSSFRKSWTRICEMINRSDLIDIQSLPRIRISSYWLKRGVSEGSQLKSTSYEERRHYSLVRGLVITSDHLASGNRIPKLEAWSPLKIQIEAKLGESFGRRLHGFQTLMSRKQGSVILRAPTGSGKTEAALLWAAKNEEMYSRLFYVLPNIASINAMYLRLVNFFGENAVGLLHSRAIEAIYRKLAKGDDIESRASEKHAGMLSSLAHSIWFPVRVCTPHQMLRFTLRGRGWETCLAEFPKSIFIFDEIHAYDPRLVGQILASAKLVRKWGAKCAFLSATMPSFLIDLINTSLAEKVGKSESLELILPDQENDKELVKKKRHMLCVEQGTVLDYIERIISDMESNRKVLVVCNTVSASQLVFEKIRETLAKKYSEDVLDKQIVMLIHSRFARRDRGEKENRLLSVERQPKILVSTQVVEVSLDISYDVAYLEPAPIDAIIQRMGRVNRNGENPNPAPICLLTQEISARSVYHHTERVKKTIEQLSELAHRRNPVSEADLVLAAEIVYEGGYDENEIFKFEQGFFSREIQNFEEEAIAGASEDWKDKVLDDAWGVDILPKVYVAEFHSKLEKGLFIEAYSHLVPMQYYNKAVEDSEWGDPPISNWKYSSLIGFTVPLNDDTWDDDLIDKAPSDPSTVI